MNQNFLGAMTPRNVQAQGKLPSVLSFLAQQQPGDLTNWTLEKAIKSKAKGEYRVYSPSATISQAGQKIVSKQSSRKAAGAEKIFNADPENKKGQLDETRGPGAVYLPGIPISWWIENLALTSAAFQGLADIRAGMAQLGQAMDLSSLPPANRADPLGPDEFPIRAAGSRADVGRLLSQFVFLTQINRISSGNNVQAIDANQLINYVIDNFGFTSSNIAITLNGQPNPALNQLARTRFENEFRRVYMSGKQKKETKLNPEQSPLNYPSLAINLAKRIGAATTVSWQGGREINLGKSGKAKSKMRAGGKNIVDSVTKFVDSKVAYPNRVISLTGFGSSEKKGLTYKDGTKTKATGRVRQSVDFDQNIPFIGSDGTQRVLLGSDIRVGRAKRRTGNTTAVIPGSDVTAVVAFLTALGYPEQTAQGIAESIKVKLDSIQREAEAKSSKRNQSGVVNFGGESGVCPYDVRLAQNNLSVATNQPFASTMTGQPFGTSLAPNVQSLYTGQM